MTGLQFRLIAGRRLPVSTILTLSSCVVFGASCTRRCARDFSWSCCVACWCSPLEQCSWRVTPQSRFSEGSTTYTVPVADRPPWTYRQRYVRMNGLRLQSAMGSFDHPWRRLPLWCIARPLGGGLSHQKDGMRSLFILICDLRRSG